MGVRTYCVYRETAIAAAQFLQQHDPATQILVADLRLRGAVCSPPDWCAHLL